MLIVYLRNEKDTLGIKYATKLRKKMHICKSEVHFFDETELKNEKCNPFTGLSVVPFNQNNIPDSGLAGCARSCGTPHAREEGQIALYSAKRVLPTSPFISW